MAVTFWLTANELSPGLVYMKSKQFAKKRLKQNVDTKNHSVQADER